MGLSDTIGRQPVIVVFSKRCLAVPEKIYITHNFTLECYSCIDQLLAAAYWLLVTGHWSLITGIRYPATRNPQAATRNRIYITAADHSQEKKANVRYFNIDTIPVTRYGEIHEDIGLR